MRFLKLLKLMAPVSLAVVALSVNPDTSSGQFPQGGKGDRGGRGGDRGSPPAGGVQFQFPTQGGTAAPAGGMQFQMPQAGGGDRGGRGGDRGGRGGFGGMPQGGSGFGGMPQGGGGGFGGMPQGGGGFGGRGGFDPNMMADSSFSRLQASYGGSGDSLDYSKIPAATREQTNAMAQRFGGEPMPASGSISKDQYRDQFAKRMEAMRGGGGRTMTTMSTPGAAPTVTGAVTFDTPGASPMAPGGQWGGQQQQWGGRGGPGGGQPGGDSGQVTDQQLQEFMRRYDKDNDGKISAAEAAGSDRLRGVFQQYDKNADGFIDMAEYRVYVSDRMSGGGGGGRGDQNGGPGQGWNGPPGGGWGGPEGGGNRPPVEEPKPVVLRYGKLPKELPSWFNSLDTNQDGQIALYEWRNDGRLATDFVPMDLNADGLVTAEEYLRYKNPSMSVSALTSGAPREGGGNPFGGGRGGNPFGGGGGESRGGNPFGGGSGGGESPRERGGNPFSRGDSSSRSENAPPSRDEKRERKDDNKGGRPTGGNPGRR